MRQIIFTAVAGLITTLMLSAPAAASCLKTTVHAVALGAFGTGDNPVDLNGTPGASASGLPGDFGLPNFVGLDSGPNGASASSDKLYVGSRSDGNGSYNVQIKKKILSF